MATAVLSIADQAKTIHQEHVEALQQLNTLENALDAIVCYGEVFTDLGRINDVYRVGRQICQSFPAHVVHEEETLFQKVEQIGPVQAEFVWEMKRQHRDLQARMQAFREAMEAVEDAPDLEGAIRELKAAGTEFLRRWALHMGAEERKLESLAA